MAQNLQDYLRTHKPKGFRAVPHFFPNGDYLTFFWNNDEAYERRVDGTLTVYHGVNSHEMVGFKIKGVQHILDTAGEFGVCIDDGEVQLGLILCLAAHARADVQIKTYKELGTFAKGVSFRREGLMSAN